MTDMIDQIRPEQYAAWAAERSVERGRWFHKHHDVEFFFDLRADVLGGPRTYHGIGWTCRCGRVEYGKGCFEADAQARQYRRDLK